MAISEFLDNLIDQVNPAQILRISIEDTSLFDFPEVTTYAEGLDWLEDVPLANKYDFVIGEFPFNGRTERYDFGGTIGQLRIENSWLKILKACEFLSENGYGLFTLPPMDFTESRGIAFNTILNSKGMNICAIINISSDDIPRELRHIHTLTIVRKNAVDSVFVAELKEDEKAETVATNLISRNATNDNLLEGLLVSINRFRGFNYIRLCKLIADLKTEYKEHQEYTINDLVSDTHMVAPRNAHTDYDNAIYVPLHFSNKRMISRHLPSDNINVHHHHLQLIFNKKVSNEYLEIFFRSHIGGLIYESMFSESGRHMMRRTSRRKIRETLIPVPSLEKQTEIVSNYYKLEFVKEKIKAFEDALSLNPTTASSELSQVDKITKILNTTD